MSISLITPVWNNAKTIAHCLESIDGQSETCEHIIVDGQSTDNTLEIIEAKGGINRVVLSEPDEGMYDAINKGLTMSEGEIVGILNSDDFYPNNRVLQEVALRFADPSVDACYGDLLYVDREDTHKIVRTWRSGHYDKFRFFNGWMPPHPTFFIRRQMYREFGGYRLDLGSAADYELMLRMLLKHNATVCYIPQVLVHMRNEGMSNASLANRIRANRFDRKAWQVNNIKPRPWTLLAKPLSKLGQWF